MNIQKQWWQVVICPTIFTQITGVVFSSSHFLKIKSPYFFFLTFTVKENSQKMTSSLVKISTAISKILLPWHLDESASWAQQQVHANEHTDTHAHALTRMGSKLNSASILHTCCCARESIKSSSDGPQGGLGAGAWGWGRFRSLCSHSQTDWTMKYSMHPTGKSTVTRRDPNSGVFTVCS